MQRPQPEIVTLSDILITKELARRSPRSPNWQAEVQAMQTLVRQMANHSETLLQSLVEMVVELCQAGTAGVSLLETIDGQQIFRWTVLAGMLAQYVGGTTPRNFSPCGVCLDRGSPQLYSYPERYFTYLQAANTPIVEGLVLPLIADSHALGTIWIMSHDEQRHFDPEDVRVMTSLADFTATALLLNQRQTKELLAANATLEAEIAERKQAEERSRALIENLPGGAVFVVDRDLRYLLAEGEALSAAGFKPEDLVGQTIFEVLPPELAADYEVLYRQALAGEPFEHEHDAHARSYISRGTPLRSPNGEVYAALAVSYDISDRKQAEENRIQLIQEQAAREEERQRAEFLANLDCAKTAFFSNVSHEFRTPLTLLLAPLQDALSDRTHPLAPHQRERLELAHRNSLRLLKLVNTLLNFSRIEADRMEAVYEPTDLATYTTELASVFRSAVERAGLQLVVDCPPLPEPVYVDREMWEKIVLNLLSNAFKFTLEGEIAVKLHPADNQVVLQIQDTGTGIAPEDLPHLFERFYQVRGAKGRVYEGSGIGLALVHELIQLHGGSIDVSSTLGQGTCFTITLPLGAKHLPNDRLRHVVGDRNKATRILSSTAIGAAPYIEEAERWLPAQGNGEWGVGSGQETSPTPSNARVLLVDDNADMRDYLTRILSEHVQVEAVADGAAALAAAQAQVPDLVLSDVMMPGLDGFGLLQALRADPGTKEIPIILLSARAGEESVVEGLEAGADDYLIKPFSAQELVSRVNAHLQMAQLRGEALRQERTTSRRKDELLSTVSHELNTPLVAILGWTRLLRANPPSQFRLMKALEAIERNATLQAKLIQDLLDISRITAGKLRLILQPVELKSVIATAIATVAQTAQAKGIALVWQDIGQGFDTIAYRDADSVIVMGDCDRLQQVICNLLTNAIKFTPESGSISVALSVIEAENSAYAQIRVTDTGIGISADFLPHVFERFRQAEKSGSASGLGLGLAIARHLVELHKGTIRAQSAGEGQGATFIVRLPLLEVEDSAIDTY